MAILPYIDEYIRDKMQVIKRLLVLGLLTPTLSRALAQETPPTSTPTSADTLVLGSMRIPRGLYDKASQFMSGKPSYTGLVYADSIPEAADVFREGYLGQAIITAPPSVTKEYTSNFTFAACTGNVLYLNVKPDKGGGFGFRKVLNQGPILFMLGQDHDAQVGGGGGLIGAIAHEATAPAIIRNNLNDYRRRQALGYDTRSGKFIVFTAKRVRDMLADAPDLLAQFEKEPSARGAYERTFLYRKYVDLYNDYLARK